VPQKTRRTHLSRPVPLAPRLTSRSKEGKERFGTDRRPRHKCSNSVDLNRWMWRMKYIYIYIYDYIYMYISLICSMGRMVYFTYMKTHRKSTQKNVGKYTSHIPRISSRVWKAFFLISKTGWWLNQPIWKIWVIPIFRGEHEKSLSCHHPEKGWLWIGNDSQGAPLDLLCLRCGWKNPRDPRNIRHQNGATTVVVMNPVVEG